MKRKKKKFNFKKLFILIIIILIAHSFIKKKPSTTNITSAITNALTNSNYDVIAKSKNDNYSGIGQEAVKNKEGYFTTFTTKEKNKKIYKEYKQNENAPWSNNEYWGGTMAENGCGITTLSIILSGYNQNYTPEDLRKKYYPVMNYDNFSKELLSFGIENSDFYFDTTHLSNKNILEHLDSNRPIIICVWNKPSNNRFTTASHYMALLASCDNMVYVSNPNGGKKDSKSSGWYDINEITPYIAKALFITAK